MSKCNLTSAGSVRGWLARRVTPEVIAIGETHGRNVESRLAVFMARRRLACFNRIIGGNVVETSLWPRSPYPSLLIYSIFLCHLSYHIKLLFITDI